MKILKPGKVEQRKFTCPKCGCEFSASKSEINTDIDLYVCPQEGCHYYAMGWDDGEPYEEPTRPTQSDLERLAELLQYDDGSWSSMDFADFLLSNGVTFREE